MDKNQQQTRTNVMAKTKPPPIGTTKSNTEHEPAQRANETSTNAEQPKP